MLRTGPPTLLLWLSLSDASGFPQRLAPYLPLWSDLVEPVAANSIVLTYSIPLRKIGFIIELETVGLINVARPNRFV